MPRRLPIVAVASSKAAAGVGLLALIAAGTAGHPVAVRLKDPHLAVQVWAANPLTGLIYCVSSTGFNLGAR